jgi:hypothetical protein
MADDSPRVELPSDVACDSIVVRESLWAKVIRSESIVSPAPVTTIVWRQGAADDDTNVHGTFLAAYAALESVRGLGQLRLEADDSLAPTIIPSRLMVAGVGGTLTFAANVVTFDAAGPFTASMVGQGLQLLVPLVNGNGGNFVIASVPSPTRLTFVNPSGSAELFPGTWRVGGWNFSNVSLTNSPKNYLSAGVAGGSTVVEHADGAFFAVAKSPVSGVPGMFRVEGYGLELRNGRLGAVIPFFGTQVSLEGPYSFIHSTNVATLPAFMAAPSTPSNIMVTGENINGGLGNQGTPAAPLIDVPLGSTFSVVGASGGVFNSVFTGAGNVSVTIRDDSFNGAAGTRFDNPLLAGTLTATAQAKPRWRVVPAAGPLTADYNNFVPVDTNALRTITLRRAFPVRGERIRVLDGTPPPVGAGAAAFPITINATAPDMIMTPTGLVAGVLISLDGNHKEFISSGPTSLIVGGGIWYMQTP